MLCDDIIIRAIIEAYSLACLKQNSLSGYCQASSRLPAINSLVTSEAIERFFGNSLRLPVCSKYHRNILKSNYSSSAVQ